MNRTMKNLLFAIALLLTTNAQAQLSDPAQTMSALLFGKYESNQSAAYAQLFMKKAELVDASGKIWKGRKAIQENFQALETSSDSPSVKKLLVSHIRLIRPDLAIAVATIHDSKSMVAYHCLCHRLDGRWYIESCSITPVLTSTQTLSSR